MRTLAIVLVPILAVPAAAAAKPSGIKIHVVANRADVLSAGDALVRLQLRKGVKLETVRVHAGRRDVTRAFKRRPHGKVMGLLTHLKVGRTVLNARAPGRRAARATLINHPSGGPVLSGPQVQPRRDAAGIGGSGLSRRRRPRSA